MRVVTTARDSARYADKLFSRPLEWGDLDDSLELSEFLVDCCALERCFAARPRFWVSKLDQPK